MKGVENQGMNTGHFVTTWKRSILSSTVPIIIDRLSYLMLRLRPVPWLIRLIADRHNYEEKIRQGVEKGKNLSTQAGESGKRWIIDSGIPQGKRSFEFLGKNVKHLEERLRPRLESFVLWIISKTGLAYARVIEWWSSKGKSATLCGLDRANIYCNSSRGKRVLAGSIGVLFLIGLIANYSGKAEKAAISYGIALRDHSLLDYWRATANEAYDPELLRSEKREYWRKFQKTYQESPLPKQQYFPRGCKIDLINYSVTGDTTGSAMLRVLCRKGENYEIEPFFTANDYKVLVSMAARNGSNWQVTSVRLDKILSHDERGDSRRLSKEVDRLLQTERINEAAKLLQKATTRREDYYVSVDSILKNIEASRATAGKKEFTKLKRLKTGDIEKWLGVENISFTSYFERPKKETYTEIVFSGDSPKGTLAGGERASSMTGVVVKGYVVNRSLSTNLEPSVDISFENEEQIKGTDYLVKDFQKEVYPRKFHHKKITLPPIPPGDRAYFEVWFDTVVQGKIEGIMLLRSLAERSMQKATTIDEATLKIEVSSISSGSSQLYVKKGAGTDAILTDLGLGVPAGITPRRFALLLMLQSDPANLRFYSQKSGNGILHAIFDNMTGEQSFPVDSVVGTESSFQIRYRFGAYVVGPATFEKKGEEYIGNAGEIIFPDEITEKERTKDYLYIVLGTLIDTNGRAQIIMKIPRTEAGIVELMNDWEESNLAYDIHVTTMRWLCEKADVEFNEGLMDPSKSR